MENRKDFIDLLKMIYYSKILRLINDSHASFIRYVDQAAVVDDVNGIKYREDISLFYEASRGRVVIETGLHRLSTFIILSINFICNSIINVFLGFLDFVNLRTYTLCYDGNTETVKLAKTNLFQNAKTVKKTRMWTSSLKGRAICNF